jgi:Glycosyl transferase family 2
LVTYSRRHRFAVNRAPFNYSRIKLDAVRLHTDSISVIVPTYREVENIPLLVSRLSQIRDTAHLDLELLLMDDDSQDGSEALVASMMPLTTMSDPVSGFFALRGYSSVFNAR